MARLKTILSQYSDHYSSKLAVYGFGPAGVLSASWEHEVMDRVGSGTGAGASTGLCLCSGVCAVGSQRPDPMMRKDHGHWSAPSVTPDTSSDWLSGWRLCCWAKRRIPMQGLMYLCGKGV